MKKNINTSLKSKVTKVITKKSKTPAPKRKKPERQSSSSEDSDMESETVVIPKKSKFDSILEHLKSLAESQAIISEKVDKLTASYEDFKTLSESLKIEVTTLSKKVYTLESENERLDLELRKKNLLIFGLLDNEADDEDTIKSKVLRLFSEKLSLNNITVDTAHKISTYSQGKHRPVRVQLIFQNDRDAILNQRQKLKNVTDELGNRIYINEDLPLKTRLCRKILRAKLAECINMNIPAKINYTRNEIIVNGKCFKVMNNALMESKSGPINPAQIQGTSFLSQRNNPAQIQGTSFLSQKNNTIQSTAAR